MILYVFLLLCLRQLQGLKLYLGSYPNSHWLDKEIKLHEDTIVTFYVALNYRNKDEMHNELLAISDPRHSLYGKHLSLEEFKYKYSPSIDAVYKVKDFFLGVGVNDEKVKVVENLSGGMIKVTAPVKSIEKHLSTKIMALKAFDDNKHVRVLKASTALVIPDNIHKHISFISLNTPFNPSFFGHKRMRTQSHKKFIQSTTNRIGVLGGNKEAILKFVVTCPNGQDNDMNPPCNNDLSFTISVQSYAYLNNKTTYETTTDPIVFNPNTKKVQCYYFTDTISKPCDGTSISKCYCYTLLSPLPQYSRLIATITTTPGNVVQGISTPFFLTDTATAAFLSKLYNIPSGLTVRYGSNQSVAEFYGQFYSNKDLYKFFELSGLPNATIPTKNIFGDLPNNEQQPGGMNILNDELYFIISHEHYMNIVSQVKLN